MGNDRIIPAPASLPSGRRIYAIGDIHGCARQLDTLHIRIAEDLGQRPIESALLLHIGDYVDRGADTAGVIARLVGGCPIPGMEMVNVMGNHESTMLDALSGSGRQGRIGCSPAVRRRWKAMGSTRRGRATDGRR